MRDHRLEGLAHVWPLLIALALGTLVSEDLTSITAGMLIREGEVGMVGGILACAVGIFAGDLGLWVLGRVAGRAALGWPWLARRRSALQSDELQRWLEHRGAAALMASRFLPGTRLPLYVMAGVVSMPFWRFAAWTFLAVLLWTPAIVLFAAWSGDTLSTRLTKMVGAGPASGLLAGSLVLLLLTAGRTGASPSGRRRILAALARWRRWEFWPMWLFYAPVALWVAILAIRHRGLSVITAANPGLPDGGVVGESKAAILSRLPSDWTIAAALIPPGAAEDRLETAAAHMRRAGWTLPVVVKPDVGQRGVGVKLAASTDALATYLACNAEAVLLQPYHPGPYEAGVFYFRRPEWAAGRILSITDKQFPMVVGDGTSTLEDLIWAHPRYRLQARTFLARHRTEARRILDAGERFRLAIAGNHAQGTLFRDGSHLLTAELACRIDAIARAYPGFCIGRFDIRYRDVDEFKAGRDLAIVELNGATAEATSIYDPNTSLVAAYRLLFRQWSLVFEIGAANRARGAQVSSMRRLFDLVRAHLSARPAFALSD